LSGPLALNMSKGISELFKYAPVQLEIDLFPDMQSEQLDTILLEAINAGLNKQIKNAISGVLAPKLIPLILTKCGIDSEKESRDITRIERGRMVTFLKHIPVTVSGFLGVEKAIVTSGGVSLDEIDFKTMRSKLYPNLFLAGDILNFDRPSGGFSLQICWTTGYLAGENSALRPES
jgi:predicted Rossmann fold flavoprotein